MPSSKKQKFTMPVVIGAGVIALVVIGFVASMFGYSLRGAVYSPAIAVNPTTTPRVTPTPNCHKFTQEEITGILNHIRVIFAQIDDLSKKIDAVEKDQASLSSKYFNLATQFNVTKDKNTRKALAIQLKAVSKSIQANNENLSALNDEIERLREEQNRLIEELQSGCVEFI